eukprot:CAMPEP_0181352174 /NCGR_PEP_ID=MMETSP1106-20121128/2167_1 /TAXON_ID=81844 /ORGANISM="Mantoniella antarctica, Strain SL-175" /LENGTH=65 /DNA_ID=CAMNT_0023464713 /DNA_START=941 /DNA_END=1138 /DNA_ORIENTATION=-
MPATFALVAFVGLCRVNSCSALSAASVTSKIGALTATTAASTPPAAPTAILLSALPRVMATSALQ